MKTLSYSKLITFESFLDRFEYLRLLGSVGSETFGSYRYINQMLYHSDEWRRIRDDIILRDKGCDLGISDRPIRGPITIHHINPLSKDSIANRDPLLFDPDNLICVSLVTHRAIHYGDSSLLYEEPLIRTPNDTCPWKGGRL